MTLISDKTFSKSSSKKTEKSSSAKKILLETTHDEDASKKMQSFKMWENKLTESSYQKKFGKIEDAQAQMKLMDLVSKNVSPSGNTTDGVQEFIMNVSMFFDKNSLAKDRVSTRVENCDKNTKCFKKEIMNFKIAAPKILLNENERVYSSPKKDTVVSKTSKTFPKKSNLPEKISTSAASKKLAQKPIAAKKSPASIFIGPKSQKSSEKKTVDEDEIRKHLTLRSEKELSYTFQEKNTAISSRGQAVREELHEIGTHASQKLKEPSTVARRTKPSEIPLRKNRFDLSYESQQLLLPTNKSLKDKSKYLNFQSSYSSSNELDLSEESSGTEKSVYLFSSDRKELSDDNKCFQVLDEFRVKENLKYQDFPQVTSPQDLSSNKNSTPKAKVLDLDLVRSSNFAVLASGETFQKLESLHQQAVSIKGNVFGDKSASSASTKLKKIASKTSLTSIKYSKKDDLLISLIDSKSKHILKSGRNTEITEDITKKRISASPKSVINKISKVCTDQKLKNTSKYPLKKSENNLNATESYGSQDKPPTDKLSPKTPENQGKIEPTKEVKSSEMNKTLEKESKSSTSESTLSNRSKSSLEDTSKSSSSSTFKMTTPCSSLCIVDGPESIKPTRPTTPSTRESDLLDKQTDDRLTEPIELTFADKKTEAHNSDFVERNSNDKDMHGETIINTETKKSLNTENLIRSDIESEMTEDNFREKKSEKIHLEIKMELESPKLVNDFLKRLEEVEKNIEDDDYVFADYERPEEKEEELVSEENCLYESALDCEFLILDEDTNLDWTRFSNSLTPPGSPKQKLSEEPIHLEVYRSFSSIKRKTERQTSKTKMKTRPKKKKLNTDSGNRSLVSSAGRYISATSLGGETPSIKGEAIKRSGLARGLIYINSNYEFEDAKCANLNRRNSEPTSLSGFVWKQPEVPLFRGNKMSASSMASSLRHMNADEIENFRVWEPAPLKMTSPWEMSLYRCRRSWSVLSCSAFKDNRIANTPGIIFENLRNDGLLDVRSTVGQRDRISSQASNSFDVEPSIAQKNMDIRNWLSALNFPTSPSTSSDVVVEGILYATPPVGSTIKNQVTTKRRKALRTLNYSKDAVKKKFEDTRGCISDEVGDLMDLIQRKSGGFVAIDKMGQQVTRSNSQHEVVANRESLPNFTEIPERETPDLGALRTRSDGPQMFPEETEEKIQNSIECTGGDRLDETKCVAEEKTPVMSKSKMESREAFWMNIFRCLNGETNFNVWKYLFIFSLSLIVYNFLNSEVVAIDSTFDS